jgi:hypothetical protein
MRRSVVMKRLTWLCAVGVIAALLAPVAAVAEHHEMDEKKHARELGLQAEAALNALYAAAPDAEAAFQKTVGWAYFHMKATGKGDGAAGHGVAMTAGSRSGFPMSAMQKTGSGKEYEWIFFFRTKEAYDAFVDGWEGGDTPKASARFAGLKPDDPFVLGVKVYSLEGSSLADEAIIATTRFKKGFE